MSDFAHPGAEPAEFEPAVLPDAPGTYITVVIRNHRIVQTGGTEERPVLIREFLDEDDFRDLTESVLRELGGVEGLSLCFVGDGFDPSSVASPDDEEALEHSEAWAAVIFVPPGALPAVHHAVTGALVEHGMPHAWVVPSGADTEIVVRARDHVPAPTPRDRDEGFFWYAAVPFPRRPDGTTVDLERSPAVWKELHTRIEQLDELALLHSLRQAYEVMPSFDPGDGPPVEVARRVLHVAADEALSNIHHELMCKLCLEGTTLRVVGDATWTMGDEEFFARFAALWASGVGDDPFDDAGDDPPLAYEPALSRMGELVAWYAGTAGAALDDDAGPAADLGERLAARLDSREAEVIALLRAAALADCHMDW